MKINGSQKIKTGIFVLIAMGVLAIIIFFIGRQKSMFTSTFPIYANFKNVSGLQIGNFVRFNGINVGTVKNISIINDTTVRVDVKLETRVKPFIKADSKASIASDGLMGDKLIQIAPGSDSAGALKDGQIASINPIEMDKIMGKISLIADDAQSLMGNLSQIVAKVNNGQGSLGRLLNSDKLEKNLESTIQSTSQTVQTINKAASNVNENMEAAKHNILFRGYFKKKEKKRIEDSTNAAKAMADSLANRKKGGKN